MMLEYLTGLRTFESCISISAWSKSLSHVVLQLYTHIIVENARFMDGHKNTTLKCGGSIIKIGICHNTMYVIIYTHLLLC